MNSISTFIRNGQESSQSVIVNIPELLYGIHISITPQVVAVVEAGQQEILRHLTAMQQRDDIMQQRDDVLIQQVKQLSELNVRHFTRQWNLEMRKIEAECPNTFVLLPGSRSSFNPKNWISQSYTLHLLCQYPSGPHRLDGQPGYDLTQSKEWWVILSPNILYLTFLLETSRGIQDGPALPNMIMSLHYLPFSAGKYTDQIFSPFARFSPFLHRVRTPRLPPVPATKTNQHPALFNHHASLKSESREQKCFGDVGQHFSGSSRSARNQLAPLRAERLHED